MRSATKIRTLRDLVDRRRWTPQQTRLFISALVRSGFAAREVIDHAHESETNLGLEGGSANFIQVAGPQGRTQTLTAGASPITFLWNPQSIKGQLGGGDFLYAKRIKFRNVLVLQNSSEGNNIPPSNEVMANAFGGVRVYSPFLGEVAPRAVNSVPLIANHDMYFANGFRPISRRRPQAASVSTGSSVTVEYVFEVPLERDYLDRSMDSCPWLPFFEGGTFEVDLNETGALNPWGWEITSCTQTCTIDYYVDKQALIHTPIQSRLYRVTTPGPDFTLKGVGSPNGLDGVISGSRLAVLSWLASGDTVAGSSAHDNGFYAAFGGSGGQNFGTNGLNRLDIPFRDQVSIDDVSAWLESFLSDCNPIRMFQNLNISPTTSDIDQWPFLDGASATAAITATHQGSTQTLVSDLLDFFPLIWPSPYDKISDMQKVNGDLTFTANQPNPPGSSILNLFRTDEVCGFTPDKVMDLMDRMGLPHKQRGGGFLYVPKYAGAKKADPTTIWGFPLKIIHAG